MKYTGQSTSLDFPFFETLWFLGSLWLATFKVPSLLLHYQFWDPVNLHSLIFMVRFILHYRWKSWQTLNFSFSNLTALTFTFELLYQVSDIWANCMLLMNKNTPPGILRGLSICLQLNHQDQAQTSQSSVLVVGGLWDFGRHLSQIVTNPSPIWGIKHLTSVQVLPFSSWEEGSQA